MEFVKAYGNIVDLMYTNINVHALQGLVHFWDPMLKYFTFSAFDLTPTLEEYQALACGKELLILLYWYCAIHGQNNLHQSSMGWKIWDFSYEADKTGQGARSSRSMEGCKKNKESTTLRGINHDDQEKDLKQLRERNQVLATENEGLREEVKRWIRKKNKRLLKDIATLDNKAEAQKVCIRKLKHELERVNKVVTKDHARLKNEHKEVLADFAILRDEYNILRHKYEDVKEQIEQRAKKLRHMARMAISRQSRDVSFPSDYRALSWVFWVLPLES
ncbi:glial fibrillary acidic protein-like [Cucumis melo var. makuwa]|uniref:Glial fibrillary acidic protein-like n=1 Tax=Cucumis melo var. makuwa TaxID=1194695 RepID=A0A5D3DHF5_CUCMM|nr:glial fibrillary acidic protein-like [Cucumis melo var. makuwa]TYK22719.1 glial fibrillary acidic protein-like [Cucumis melo var. makuwa]